MKPMSWEAAELIRWLCAGDFSFVHDLDSERMEARLRYSGFGTEVFITSSRRNSK